MTTARATRARRWLASARVRIVVWHLLLLAVVLALAIATMRVVLLVRLDERIDRDLQQEVEELRSLAGGTDPATGAPFAGDVARILEVFMERNIPDRNETFLTYLDGRPHLRSLNEPPVRLDRDPEFSARVAAVDEPQRGAMRTREAGDIAFHAVPLRVDGRTEGVFASAWFRDIEAAEIDDVVRLAGGLSALALVFAAVVVWNVAGRVLLPARAVASTARSITETDLTRRIDVQGNDEIAEIAATFNGMLDRLETAFGAQRDFLNDAGHELRTPVTIIRGHLELLEIGDEDARKATVELVTDELDRMHRMVEDLLLLGNAQRPDFLRRHRVELHELTSEVFHKSMALADRRWLLGHVAEGEVDGDRQRLTQALVQLAQNAVQHTGEGDTITVGSAVEGGQARLWVADSGPGVDPAHVERIFDRFARGGGGPRTGAGLGLAIVKAIAEAHGGRVEVTETPGGGATFTLVLPAVAAGSSATQGPR